MEGVFDEETRSDWPTNQYVSEWQKCQDHYIFTSLHTKCHENSWGGELGEGCTHLSLSLSLSLTHTHTHTTARACPPMHRSVNSAQFTLPVDLATYTCDWYLVRSWTLYSKACCHPPWPENNADTTLNVQANQTNGACCTRILLCSSWLTQLPTVNRRRAGYFGKSCAFE